MTDAKINETIKAREAEIASVVAAFNARKAEVQKMIDEWNKFGSKCQHTITHFEGCVAELRKMLPKTTAEKKADRKKKK